MPKSIVREQRRPVKPPAPEELREFVQMVLRTMKRRGELHGNEEDAFQWAALAIWEGVVLRCVPLGPGTRAYHFRAARLRVIYQGRRAQSPVSVYDRFAREAPIGWADPADLDVPGGHDPGARRKLEDERRASDDLAIRIYQHISAEGPRARGALRIALERDSDTPLADAAWLTGTTVLELNAALSRVGKRVRADEEAVQLRKIAVELSA